MEGNNNNRFYLNLGNGNDRSAPNDRAYPTTPSTFPQPVFPNQGQQPGMPQQQQPGYASGYPPNQGYFMQNQYQNQYPAQGQGEYGVGQNSGYQQRSTTPGTNDPNTGLAHQFSHQNLSGASRAPAYGSRGPSPARPRTAGNSGQQAPYNNYSNVPLPTQASAPVSEFHPAPERNPDKYGTNANSNQKKCSQLASDFFKDSVKRARERNQRYICPAIPRLIVLTYQHHPPLL
jgi:protein-serine/threonine kinase